MDTIRIVRRGLLANDKRGWYIFLHEGGKLWGEITDEIKKTHVLVERNVTPSIYSDLLLSLAALSPSNRSSPSLPLAVIKKQSKVYTTFQFDHKENYKTDSLEMRVLNILNSLNSFI